MQNTSPVQVLVPKRVEGGFTTLLTDTLKSGRRVVETGIPPSFSGTMRRTEISFTDIVCQSLPGLTALRRQQLQRVEKKREDNGVPQMLTILMDYKLNHAWIVSFFLFFLKYIYFPLYFRSLVCLFIFPFTSLLDGVKLSPVDERKCWKLEMLDENEPTGSLCYNYIQFYSG